MTLFLPQLQVVINYVSKMLGHADLTTTTRDLNTHRRELHRAVEKLEAHQKAVAQALHTSENDTSWCAPPRGSLTFQIACVVTL